MVFLIISCKKKPGGPTELSGTVIDASSKRAIPYADVWMVSKGRAFMSQDTAIAYQKADGRGCFSLAFNADPDNAVYYIYARASSYVENSVYPQYTAGTKTSDISVPLQPLGWIKFRIVNVPPKDTIYQFTTGDNYDIPELFKDTDIVIQRLPGNRDILYQYLIRKTNQVIKKLDNVIIPPMDTLIYRIEY